MRCVRRTGDRVGLAALLFSVASAAGAALLAARAPALHQATRPDLVNAGLLLLVLIAGGAIGNGFAMVGAGHVWFARWWWGFVALLAAVLFGVCLGIHASLSLGLVAPGGALLLAMEVVELVALPLEFGRLLHGAFRDAKRYPNSESFRLVRPRHHA